MQETGSTLGNAFSEAFSDSPLIVRSPGRINIIGEHTDYNEGLVLPAAINKAAYVAISARDDCKIKIMALDLGESIELNIEELQPVKKLSWPNYVLGPAAQLLQKGHTLKGFNLMLTSDIPIGAGLSSSAAVECATIFALNRLFSLGLNRIALLKMAQKAEHEYAGVRCGIMDQFASMMGKENHAIQLDCRSLTFDYIPVNLKGISLVLLNTNVKHSLGSSEYNTRRTECETAVDWLRQQHKSVHSLRDANMQMLRQYILPKSEHIFRRAGFIVKEISRLLEACEDLKKNNIAALGKKMFATHEGLSADYEVSCTELDWLIEFVRKKKDVFGARMMGGGFGGCTLNLVKSDKVDELIHEVKAAYEICMHMPLSAYTVSIEDGAREIL